MHGFILLSQFALHTKLSKNFVLHQTVDPPGFEPGAFGLQSRRSSTELRAL